jgi:tetratricopeptide (TPR) repeat protein
MWRFSWTLCLLLALGGWVAAQEPQAAPGEHEPTAKSQERNKEAGESSSRDTRIDLSAPKDDAKSHPDSAEAVSEAEGDDSSDSTSSDVREFHPWNPHKAAKDVEVGDFYFKRKNYRAALSRYREALLYKNNDAIAQFRLAQCLEKMDQPEEARVHYQEYLKILPHGPYAEDAQKALEKLSTASNKAAKTEQNEPKR